MNIFVILLLSVALALDAFAVAVGAGTYFKKTSFRQKFRLSFHFGLFQLMMPIAGWFAGSGVEKYISSFDHWAAFFLLALIGGRMIHESFSSRKDDFRTDITRGWKLIILSVASSIDALAVGFSLAILNESIILPCIIIGLVTSVLTLLGILAGEKLSGAIGTKANLAGGIVLILIGIEIVLEHLGLF